MIKDPNIYLTRYAYPKFYLDYEPDATTELIVVLPCHNESELLISLAAIDDCDSQYPVEIIVVINAAEDAPEEVKQQNINTYNAVIEWQRGKKELNKNFHFILENDLPKKHAGVGLARKIGMDEAVRMFEAIDKPNGVILCFDADCTCEQNLLTEVSNFFKENPSSPGCSINFEHPLEGELPEQVYKAITFYEMHLRYYVDALKYAVFPYAFQTIGSSMAVRSAAYQKQGGMNRRKAGEDFYFLHKIIPLGDFGEVNTTTIYPSPRASDRVPFGTGRAVGEWLSGDQREYLTYNHQIFEDLKNFLAQVDSYFRINHKDIQKQVGHLSESIREFLTISDFDQKIAEVKSQSTNIDTFRKRFYQWFDGFRVLKYVHFARDHYYPNISTSEAVKWLFQKYNLEAYHEPKEMLLELRRADKSKIW
ncbi:glycosyltransferase family A protein [Reichenbachiella sp. MALMAid0571]|uniref:glycosyltransferase n=1 Tax=Reichenbachiella sp. MALMAid0571 TaxID=3143939 RepID=UPI0032DEB840